jgi:ribokinase
MGRVIVVGSLNVDLVTMVERHPSPGETVLGESVGRFAGGKGANQAVAARRAGAEVVMVGAVGNDDAGDAYLQRLAELGIESRVHRIEDTPTGAAVITIDRSGENSIIVVPGANSEFDAREVGAGPGDVVLLQLEIPLECVSRVARESHRAGARVVVNLAPYASLPDDVVTLADPLVVNESEAALLADAGLMPRSLLVTFGAAGAMWDGERVDGIAVAEDEVVDTVGAGDAFCGALAAALADGDDRTAALRRANAAGAAAVRWSGAQPDGRL